MWGMQEWRGFKLCKDGNYRRKKSKVEKQFEECIKKMKALSDDEQVDYEFKYSMRALSDEMERVKDKIIWYEKMIEESEDRQI